MSGEPIAEAIEVSKRFGRNVIALNLVGLRVAAGRTHALVGRNGAGKSTLVSILTGLATPDEGEVRFNGRPAPAPADRDAWRARVACVYQKSTIIPDLSVAENLFINRQGLDRRIINWRKLRGRARELLDTWSVPVDVDTVARDLSVEHRQLVEIARSLSYGARFIILDEPTAQLDGPAIKRLFNRIRDLQAQGVTFLFISHHLDETYEICQDITVFRDAEHVLTAPAAELGKQDLIAAMTGDSVELQTAAPRAAPDTAATPTLLVEGLSGAGEFTEVTFQVSPREIVGLAGGGSSGRIEVAETIVGLRKAAAGSVLVSGRLPRRGGVRAALDAGIGFVPRDRHEEGLIPEMSVADNATLTVPRRVGRLGLLSRRTRNAVAGTAIDALGIKTSGPDQSVAELSGGNQQKVVFARALATDPAVLVLITPTAGVDVRSKQTLRGVVRAAADRGTAVLVVSDELDDLRDCDRVLVMVQGRIAQEFEKGWGDRELVAAMEGL
ncbi:sugar ABC transporter ATP-binding protein [Nocardia brasiliensis]|uniref:ABC transporter ATP-binding protein n=1 Tax=Nocardia brasiliensis (strain ATCC 700358 / HUJEG-1) TaxID=1133849 RepID=K0EP52_NOCB7|nr:sugar ABC transporter ATP-binding protein [Nocardia brasiliensis]AFU01463.1 ABC transporter ATP-binding protein [Nocardia brasiliensis ATCC 700358]OCF85962.1 multidrug ABC transporter ATP-binding protein [Nocardia brasiliensis]